MAIEFNCPYCTATVRVGDAASGKIGRCPKCETRIRVPSIAPPQGGPAPQPTRSIEETPSETDIPLFGSPDSGRPSPASPVPATDESPGEFPFIQPKPEPVATSSYLRRRNKKKPNPLGNLIPPLLFGGLLIGIGMAYLYWSQPSYEAAVTGTRMSPDGMLTTTVQGRRFDIPQEVFDELVDELRQNMSDLYSNLVQLQFRGGPRGLEIGLRPGVDADLVKVPVLSVPSVSRYYEEQYNAWDEARLAEMQRALSSLCQDWVQASEQRKTATLPEYRHELAYNAFVFGLGRICEAVIDNARYPCVHEDARGFLYFLVPTGTERFVIRERADLREREGPFFPSRFAITVQVQTEEPKPAPKPDAELIPYEPIDDPDGETAEDAPDEETAPKPDDEDPDPEC
jgi:hypothetical protein